MDQRAVVTTGLKSGVASHRYSPTHRSESSVVSSEFPRSQRKVVPVPWAVVRRKRERDCVTRTNTVPPATASNITCPVLGWAKQRMKWGKPNREHESTKEGHLKKRFENDILWHGLQKMFAAEENGMLGND